MAISISIAAFRRQTLFCVGLVFASSVTLAKSENVQTPPMQKKQWQHSIDNQVVFPVWVDQTLRDNREVDPKLEAALEEVWWEFREVITQSSMIAVASRTFLERSNALQPRGELSTADAVILAKHLEADATTVLLVRDSQMQVNVYDGDSGLLIWWGTEAFTSDSPRRTQLVKGFRKLASQYVQKLGYSGSLKRHSGANQNPNLEVGRILEVDIRPQSLQPQQLVVGFRRSRTNLNPLLLGGSFDEPIFNGQVVEITEGSKCRIKVLSISHGISEKIEGTLFIKIENAQAVTGVEHTELIDPLAAEILKPADRVKWAEQKERRTVATAISTILSVVAGLLLAF